MEVRRIEKVEKSVKRMDHPSPLPVLPVVFKLDTNNT
jgi:hypothetical protein